MPNANLEQEIAKLKKELREIKQAHQKEKDA
jgi:Tfp pilus assembly protein PilN